MKRKLTAALVSCFLTITGGAAPAMAQVAQWNQIIVDRELRQAFYRAVRESAVEYIDKLDKDGVAGTITFVDHQLDYPIQMTSSHYRHVTINAAQGKAAYLLRYQAKSTAGTNIPIAGLVGLGTITGRANYAGGNGGGSSAEIPGDGGMMLCPINRTGLEFMFGGLAVASVGENGEFRVEQDGKDIIALHDRILARTYEYYGATPKDGDAE